MSMDAIQVRAYAEGIVRKAILEQNVILCVTRDVSTDVIKFLVTVTVVWKARSDLVVVNPVQIV